MAEVDPPSVDPPEELEPAGALQELGAAEVEEFDLPRGGPYDPSRDRERIRSALAMGAGGLLTLTVLLIAVPVAVGWRSWDEMEGLASTVLPAVVSVTASVIGFYFGAEKTRRG